MRSAARLEPVPFIRLVALAGVVSLTIPALWMLPLDALVPVLVVLTALSVALEFAAVQLPYEGTLSVATIPHIATILLLPPPFAALSVALAVGVEEVANHRPRVKIAFNVASFTLTVSLASFAVGLLGDPWAAVGRRDDVRLALMIVTAALVYQTVNKALISGIISIASGHRFSQVMRRNARNTTLTELGAGTLGALFAILWAVHPLWTVLLAVPAAVVSRTLRYVRQLERETHSAVRALARVVDHRDSTTAHHSERVALYAVTLATELALDEDLVEIIEQAASVHDLGKIGVPDGVLLKPGPLTADEQTAMWLHTEIGAEILNHYELFRDGAQIVLHHHERYDGSGYPRGLAGDAIPLGARVVAVADAFDAMTSNRPYRTALSVEEANSRLRAGAGTQWDPAVVEAFLRLMAQERITVAPVEGGPAAASTGSSIESLAKAAR